MDVVESLMRALAGASGSESVGGRVDLSLRPGGFARNESLPGRTCMHIKQVFPGAIDGIYWIKPLESYGAFEAYCDMTTDGEGRGAVSCDVLFLDLRPAGAVARGDACLHENLRRAGAGRQCEN